MQDIEEIRARRDNIEAIEPVVSSMRTISAGGWRQALQRREASTAYCAHVEWVLSSLAPNLPAHTLGELGIGRAAQPARRPLLLVISSQRGLCGAYNDLVARGANQLITSQSVQSDDVLIAALGSRAAVQLRRLGRTIEVEWALPTSRVASMELVTTIKSQLREMIATDTVDAIYIIYSPYRSGTLLPPISERWLPVDQGMLPGLPADRPEIIVEGDPVVVFERAMEEWLSARLYRIVIDAAASEQAARYRAMDTASTNLARITEELTLQYHSARQHTITMEMLDLVSGAEGSRRRPSETDA